MGFTKEDRDGLDKTLKDLNLTNEVIICGYTCIYTDYPFSFNTYFCGPMQETEKFSKAFKDPEFIKLFEEYAKEVSDPKVQCNICSKSPP